MSDYPGENAPAIDAAVVIGAAIAGFAAALVGLVALAIYIAAHA